MAFLGRYPIEIVRGRGGRDARRSLNGFVHFQYLNIIVVISGSKRKNIGFLHSISDDDRNAGLLL